MPPTRGDAHIAELTSTEMAELSKIKSEVSANCVFVPVKLQRLIVSPGNPSPAYHKFWKELLSAGTSRGWLPIHYVVFLTALGFLHSRLAQLPRLSDTEFASAAVAAARDLEKAAKTVDKLGLNWTIDDVIGARNVFISSSKDEMPIVWLQRLFAEKLLSVGPPSRESKQGKRLAMDIGVAFIRQWNEFFEDVPSEAQVRRAFQLLWPDHLTEATAHNIESWRGIIKRGGRKTPHKGGLSPKDNLRRGANRLEEAMAGRGRRRIRK